MIKIIYLVVALGQNVPVLHSEHGSVDECNEMAESWMNLFPSQPRWSACLSEQQKERFFKHQEAFIKRITI